MKIEFNVLIQDKIHSEVVEVNEDKIKGSGFTAKNKISNLLDAWIMDKVVKDSYFRIIEDDRFVDEPNNIDYVDFMESKRLGWLNDEQHL